MRTPKEIAETYVEIGVGKVNQPARKLLLLGVFAGAFIAFGALASQVVSVTIASASVARLLSACVFPAGLTMVLLAGSELFTGNCLLVIPVLQKKCSVASMLRNWVFVYIGNFIGALFVAAVSAAGHVFSLFDGKLAESAAITAAAKMTISPGDAFLRGILCNILVCIAVWISFAANTPGGKILGLFFPVMLFVLCGFEHSVANMYYFPAGYLCSRFFCTATPLSFAAFFANNLLPVTLGNILGGAAVGAGYRAAYLR